METWMGQMPATTNSIPSSQHMTTWSQHRSHLVSSRSPHGSSTKPQTEPSLLKITINNCPFISYPSQDHDKPGYHFWKPVFLILTQFMNYIALKLICAIHFWWAFTWSPFINVISCIYTIGAIPSYSMLINLSKSAFQMKSKIKCEYVEWNLYCNFSGSTTGTKPGLGVE